MRVQRVWTSGNDLAYEGTWEWGFNTGDLVSQCRERGRK